MRSIYFALVLSLLSACSSSEFLYDLNNPDSLVLLPDILNEVSGLSDVDSNHVACVQDELGRIFIVNIHNGMVLDEFDFSKDGDFEGLTYLDSVFYVLRSDAVLYVVSGYHSGEIHAKSIDLELASRDNEGFGFDPVSNLFLVAAKSKNIGEKGNNKRVVHALNRSGFTLEEKPALTIDTDLLAVFAIKHGIEQQNFTKKGKQKSFSFRPSSIAVHPDSGHYYIISAEDFLIIVMNRQGEVVFMETLDEQLFPKAEGITFLGDGTMIITNESVGSGSSLLRFNMKNQKMK